MDWQDSGYERNFYGLREPTQGTTKIQDEIQYEIESVVCLGRNDFVLYQEFLTEFEQ